MEEIEVICPAVEGAFNLLARKWAGLVIHVLASGGRRFSELECAIPGVSPRMLNERIKELEEAGIVTRSVETARPVRVRYELTDKGRALLPVVRGIEKWARAWAAHPGAASSPRKAS
jgi:DNA-binding HxlR family transcriptional regulator